VPEGALPVASPTPATKQEPAAVDDPERWKDAIGLLVLVDPKMDAVNGEWTVVRGELIGDKDGYLASSSPTNHPLNTTTGALRAAHPAYAWLPVFIPDRNRLIVMSNRSLPLPTGRSTVYRRPARAAFVRQARSGAE
jgi:hypothetical protein